MIDLEKKQHCRRKARTRPHREGWGQAGEGLLPPRNGGPELLGISRETRNLDACVRLSPVGGQEDSSLGIQMCECWISVLCLEEERRET